MLLYLDNYKSWFWGFRVRNNFSIYYIVNILNLSLKPCLRLCTLNGHASSHKTIYHYVLIGFHNEKTSVA